ncbi:hypothetical protein TSAR_016910 [Trichomalopsis sarcophagae]|uniref:Uncharacterized protein n=1 Tax=Trichomalopsis sarcophagae TaxID=543379 RepID=A0A232F7I0_9HYME|nr:hypothetical protein TSAR_016910 [Trichomalopsis sarcophagae]
MWRWYQGDNSRSSTRLDGRCQLGMTERSRYGKLLTLTPRTD